MNKAFFSLLLCLAFAPFVNALADKSYYDQQEDIRRTAEQIVQYDQRQRDEAKARADKKEYETQQANESARSASYYANRSTWEAIRDFFMVCGALVLVVVVFAAFGVIK